MTYLLQSDLVAVEWLRDIPDDLDVCIAQRDFEGAMCLIEKGIGLFQGWIYWWVRGYIRPPQPLALAKGGAILHD